MRYTTEGAGVLPAASFNTFGHGKRLAGPDDTFVSINNDTVYSFAQLDLGVGPSRSRCLMSATAMSSFSLSMRGRTTLRTSARGRPAPGRAAM